MHWGWVEQSQASSNGANETHFHSALVPEGSAALHPLPACAQGLWRDKKVGFCLLLLTASAVLAAWPPDLPSSRWHLSSHRARGLLWCQTALLLGEENRMQANAEQPQ